MHSFTKGTRVRTRTVTAEDIRRTLAQDFPNGEPEFETEAWHDWSSLRGSLRLIEIKED